MFLSEAEAKKKTCIFQLQANMIRPDDQEITCLGSMCMTGWQWSEREPTRRFFPCIEKEAVEEPTGRPAYVPGSWLWCPYAPEHEDFESGWSEPQEEAAARRRGFCGFCQRQAVITNIYNGGNDV